MILVCGATLSVMSTSQMGWRATLRTWLCGAVPSFPGMVRRLREGDMRIYPLLLPFVGTALVSSPVLAQPSQSTAPSPQANAGGRITQMQPDQWPTSKLEGVDVYSSNNGDKIGDIRDLIVDGSGTVQAVVIRIGGYLGLGERDIAVPFDQIKIVNEARVNTSCTTMGEARLAGTSPGGGTVASPAAAGQRQYPQAIPALPPRIWLGTIHLPLAHQEHREWDRRLL